MRLKKQINEIIQPFNFAWQPLLTVKSGKKSVSKSPLPEKQAVTKHKNVKKAEVYPGFKLVPGHLYDFPLFTGYGAELLGKLNKSKNKSLLVLPKRHLVMEAWKAGLAHGVFPPSESYSQESFARLLKKT